jgi:hypothetical protein
MVAIALAVALVVAIVVVGSRAVRGAPRAPASGLQTLRRVLEYAFLLGTMFAAATGTTRLLAAALPAGVLAGHRTEEVALGLSLTLVAVPAWAFLWRLVARRLATDSHERAAPAWALYLVAASTVSLIVAFTHLVAVGRWAVGVEEYQAGAIAYAVVWTALWGATLWLLRHPRLGPTSAWPELGVLAGCAVGLVGLALGAVGVIWYGLGELYRLVFGPALVDAPTVVLRESAVVGVLAAAVWWWHWLRQATAGTRSTAWHAYVVLVPVLGGLASLVTALGVALHAVLQWWLGVPEAQSAAVHFEVLPAALAAATVGAWSWAYHRAVLREAAPAARTEPERVYAYLVAAVGLIAAGAGVTVAVMAVVQALTPGALATADPGGRNTLVVAVTLLAVGAPLWGVFWRRAQRWAVAAGAGERRAPSRRAYLFLLFGVTGLTAVIGCGVILFVLFRDLLEGTLAVTVAYELRAAIGLVLTAGGVSAYHWTVHRDDRAATPAEEPGPTRSVLLVSPDGRQLATTVAARTGARVRRLHRLDAPAAAVDAEEVSAAILASPHARLVVTVEGDGRVRVIPYDLE